MYSPYACDQPPLHFDDDTKTHFLKFVSDSTPRTVLEFGAGGSSFFWMEQGAERVVSVETDKSWLDKLALAFVNQSFSGSWVPIHADVGETSDWGVPIEENKKHLYTNYWHASYSYCVGAGILPDVVLIDGRFRAVTALASSVYFDHSHTLLFDDYSERSNYHYVEEYLGKPEFLGRMAKFQVHNSDSGLKLEIFKVIITNWADVG